MKDNYIISLLAFLLGLLSGYLLFDKFGNNDTSIINKVEHDTVFTQIASVPLILEKVKTKIIYKKDTVIVTNPFIASIDTIVKHDTVHAEYEFPENIFSLNVRSKPDTLQTVYIKTYERANEQTKWWERPAYILGGCIAGYFIGKFTK